VQNACNGRSYEQFAQDETLKRACVRSFEIIGEAVKNLSNDLKIKRRDVDWKQIAGMRDKLIHNYFSVDWRILWDAITEKLPPLKREILDLLNETE
jgi:uncharacterized protein with HEPN domain